MTPLRVFVPGLPQGKGRARTRVIVGKSGKAFAAHYTPEKTRTYEGVIATAGAAALNGAPLLAGPLHLEFTAVVLVPQSWPNWKREAALRGEVLPTTKPDLDNIEKALLDGFNTVIWTDDVQVVRVVKGKAYGATPGITCVVTAVPGQAAQTARKAATRMVNVNFDEDLVTDGKGLRRLLRAISAELKVPGE